MGMCICRWMGYCSIHNHTARYRLSFAICAFRARLSSLIWKASRNQRAPIFLMFYVCALLMLRDALVNHCVVSSSAMMDIICLCYTHVAKLTFYVFRKTEAAHICCLRNIVCNTAQTFLCLCAVDGCIRVFISHTSTYIVWKKEKKRMKLFFEQTSVALCWDCVLRRGVGEDARDEL